MSFVVTLNKGPKGTRTWEDPTRRRALQRVYALSDLHGDCPFVEYATGAWIVDANKWYERGARRT